MSGRRRDARYGLSVPQEGLFRVSRSVMIERREGHELYVISDMPETVGQKWTLRDEGAKRDGIAVRLADCRSITVDGRTKYRLRFAVVNS